MTDLVVWLNGRLDELEATAKAAAKEASWMAQRGDVWTATDRNKVRAPGGTISWETGERFATIHEHIALNDPASALRRVAAERKLLTLHTADEAEPFLGRVESCCRGCGKWGTWTEYPCETLVILAEGHGWAAE